MKQNRFGEYMLPHGYVTEDKQVVAAWNELRNRISDSWIGTDDEDSDMIIAAYLSDWLGASTTLKIGDFSDMDSITDKFEGIHATEQDAREHMVDLWIECNEVPAQVVGYIDTDRVVDEMMMENWVIAEPYDAYGVVIFRA